jgi:hypothetical protein
MHCAYKPACRKHWHAGEFDCGLEKHSSASINAAALLLAGRLMNLSPSTQWAKNTLHVKDMPACCAHLDGALLQQRLCRAANGQAVVTAAGDVQVLQDGLDAGAAADGNSLTEADHVNGQVANDAAPAGAVEAAAAAAAARQGERLQCGNQTPG